MEEKVIDVMLLCSELLKNQALTDCLKGTSDGDEKTLSERADYLRVYEMVVDELAFEYFPLKAEEIKQVENGKVKLSSLNFTPIDVLGVYDAEGSEPIEYELFATELRVKKEGKVKIVYSHAAPRADEQDDFIYSLKPGKFVVACGMAAEICLENGLTGEASLWRNKFDCGVRGRVAERRKLVIKPRRWL